MMKIEVVSSPSLNWYLLDTDKASLPLTRIDIEQLLRSGGGFGINLSGLNLKGIDLSHLSLRKANLSGADLSEANLTGIDLSDANLKGALLSHAILNEA